MTTEDPFRITDADLAEETARPAPAGYDRTLARAQGMVDIAYLETDPNPFDLAAIVDICDRWTYGHGRIYPETRDDGTVKETRITLTVTVYPWLMRVEVRPRLGMITVTLTHPTRLDLYEDTIPITVSGYHSLLDLCYESLARWLAAETRRVLTYRMIDRPLDLDDPAP